MKKFMKGCAIVALVMIIAGVGLAVAAGSVAGTQSISQVVDSVTDGRVQVNLNGLTEWGVEVKDNIVEQMGGLEVKYDIDDNTMFDNDYEVFKGDLEKFSPGENVKKLEA